MNTHVIISSKHQSGHKDNKSETTRISFDNVTHELGPQLDIAGLEHMDQDISQDMYYPDEIEIEGFKYLFKRDDSNTDGSEFDRVCPLCAQFVAQGSTYLVFTAKELQRKFIGHYQCLMNKQAQRYKFIQLPERFDEAVLRHDPQPQSTRKSIELTHSYYATLTISHPISNIKYLQLDKKLVGWNAEQLTWFLGNRESLLFSPNTICIPYTDFKFSLVIDYHKITKTYEFLVNLNRRESKKKSYVQASTSNITLDMDVITNHQQKQVIVSQMNYIYPFPKPLALIRLNQLRVRIPEELQDLETSYSERKCEQPVTSVSFSSASHKQIYNMQDQMIYYPRVNQPMMPPDFMFNMQQSPLYLNQQPFDNYYNDIQELIQSGKIKQFVQTSNGSREFQKFLKKCTYEEVELVLNSSYEDLPGFVVHDYANYMFQGLVYVCSPEQRIRIITKLAPFLPHLSQNKKGTHSLQTLITVITTAQQASIVCKAMQKDFIALSQNQNATHLIQKIIQTFEPSLLTQFFAASMKQFLSLCKNACGTCVLKAIMKKTQGNEQMTTSIVGNIGANLDSIIQDPFGNYIVQFAFDTFGEEKCQKIVDEIVNKFTQYSIQKYSGNVIEKCITQCKNIHALAIASIIDAGSLEEILKTTIGNSILLKLVRSYPDKDIEERIRKILSLPRMSKYSNNWDSHFFNIRDQKAATCKNIHGETFNNFSQAAEMAKGSKAKKGSFTPKMRKF